MYVEIYICDHPVYSRCTLYQIDKKGLAVIQQRYDPKTKHTWRTEIDPWITDDLYLHPKFKEFFNDSSGPCRNDSYPTVIIQQIMWSLKMKPIKREQWDICFDRRNI